MKNNKKKEKAESSLSAELLCKKYLQMSTAKLSAPIYGVQGDPKKILKILSHNDKESCREG